VGAVRQGRSQGGAGGAVAHPPAALLSERGFARAGQAAPSRITGERPASPPPGRDGQGVAPASLLRPLAPADPTDLRSWGLRPPPSSFDHGWDIAAFLEEELVPDCHAGIRRRDSGSQWNNNGASEGKGGSGDGIGYGDREACRNSQAC
jgi:hypothetical protein